MDPHDRLFGEIAVQLHLLTRKQLSACMHSQKSEPGKRALGEVARQLGHLTANDVKLVTAQRAKVLERRRQARRSGMGPAPNVQRNSDPAPPEDDRSATQATGSRPPQPRASDFNHSAMPSSTPEFRSNPPVAGTGTGAGPQGTMIGQAPEETAITEPPRAAVGPGAGTDSGAGKAGTMLGIHAPGEHPIGQPPAVGMAQTSASPEGVSQMADSEFSKRTQTLPPTDASNRLKRAWRNASRPLVPSDTVFGTGPGAIPTPVPSASSDPGHAPTEAAGFPSPVPPKLGGTGPGLQSDEGAAAQQATAAQSAAQHAAMQAEQAARRAEQQVEQAIQAANSVPSPAVPSLIPPEDRVLLKAPLRRPVTGAVGGDYLNNLLNLAVEHGASDLHVHSNAEVMARISGQLMPMSSGQAMKPKAAEKVMAEIMTDAQWERLAVSGQADFAYELPGLGRFRVNAYKQQGGLDIVFRIIPNAPPTLEDLGLPANLANLVDYRTGMVLCTGPAGCGKSSTLAALVSLVVGKRRDHVLTVEDPVEFVYPRGLALVNQRQVETHTKSYASALKAALREDPDIIVIAEMRDLETISLAMSAAETGHLVLGSLHTGSATQTINRITSVFPADEQEQARVMLAESLRAVISQRLVPAAEGERRVPALELLMVSTAVSNIIRDNKTYQLPSVMQTGKAMGMVTLDDSLQQLVDGGTITRHDAQRFAIKKERFAE